MISWDRPGSPVNADCSPEALEKVRLHSIEGLLALPRVGMGVGGLLLGTREGIRISILGSEEIACSHAVGPSFSLTDAEVARAVELARAERQLQVVGWYVAKPRAASGLSEHDVDLFARLCPDPWQVTLLIRPSMVRSTQVAMYFRDAEGHLASGGDRDLEPWTPEHAVEAEPEPAPEPVAPPAPAIASPIAPVPNVPPVAPVIENIPVPVAAAPVASVAPTISTPPAAVSPPAPTESPTTPFERVRPMPARQPAPVAGFAPTFGVRRPPPRKRRKHWLLALAGIVGCTAAAALILTRDAWMPRPPLKLDASDANGHVTVRWNREAVEGLEGASLLLDDGGKLQTIPLDRAALRRGEFGFDRTADRVTATMKIGDAREYTSFEAPPKPTTPPPAALPDATPADANAGQVTPGAVTTVPPTPGPAAAPASQVPSSLIAPVPKSPTPVPYKP
jgi:hypothetical protein